MSLPFPVTYSYPQYPFEPPRPDDTQLSSLYDNWPADKQEMIDTAQNTRTRILSHIRMKSPCQVFIDDYIEYVNALREMEKYMNGDHKVQFNKKTKSHWKQTGIVKKKYERRSFTGAQISTELVQGVFALGVLYLKDGNDAQYSGDKESAIEQLRKAAGVFQFLATDRLRVVGRGDLPPEFETNTLRTLHDAAIGQAVIVIASKSDISPSASSKLLSFVYTIFQGCLEKLEASKRVQYLSKSFISWLEGMKGYTRGLSCMLLAFVLQEGSEYGKALSVMRLAIENLAICLETCKKGTQSYDEIRDLLEKLRPMERKWTEENVRIYSAFVPDKSEAMTIAMKQTTQNVSLPSAIPFQLSAV